MEIMTIKKRMLCKMLSMSSSTISRKLKKGDPSYDPTFPKPIKSGRYNHWILEEVKQWLNNKVNKRDSDIKKPESELAI